ncbi:MAG: hypothetical protein ABJF88_15930 [Rhodothermales bacterium]
MQGLAFSDLDIQGAVSEQLAEHYRRMPDERLLQIALHEAADLTPEALRVLNSELTARGINSAVGRAVEAQTRSLSRRDLDLLVEAVRKQRCPACGKSDHPLNGGVVADAKSFVLVTSLDKRTVVACPACLAAQAKRAALMTALLGWWAIPWGPIRTIQALTNDFRTMRQSQRSEASDALRAFVEQNPGVATAFSEGEAAL